MRDGCGGHERDEPADDALVLVEVAVGDALHVRGGDRAVGVLERVVERPVAGGDALVDAAGDGEGAVARVGDVGELLVDRGGDLGGGDAVAFEAFDLGEDDYLREEIRPSVMREVRYISVTA